MVRAQGADLGDQGVDLSGNREKGSGTRAEQRRGEREVMSLEIVRGSCLF